MKTLLINIYAYKLILLFKEWYDFNLSWNKSEYDNIESIRLPSTKIWTPDILMYNR